MKHQDEIQAKPAPLQGIRIVDLTTVLAGPYCTYQLGLLGAEVIKIERPGQGDWARNGALLPDIPEFSAQFVAQNAGKKSITLNLQSDQGRAIALKLIKSADILVENFSPGVADRLGLGYTVAREYRKDIVYCALSGYGQDGPISRRPAYDHVIQAMSGITMLTGTKESVPNRIGPPLFDYLAGMYGAFAVMAALRERDRTGQSQMVDVAMLDAAMVAMASTVSTLVNGGIEPQPNGNIAASGSPASGIFETKDGLLSMTANQDQQVIRLCRVLELGTVLEDARFASTASRKANTGEFRRLLSSALLRRTALEWEQLMAESHVPAAKVRTVMEALSEPQLAHREVQQRIQDPVTGHAFSVPSIGFKWNQFALGPAGAPPRLGQHTVQTLAALGLSELEIETLRITNVI